MFFLPRQIEDAVAFSTFCGRRPEHATGETQEMRAELVRSVHLPHGANRTLAPESLGAGARSGARVRDCTTLSLQTPSIKGFTALHT
jgi:hypothetical protein